MINREFIRRYKQASVEEKIDLARKGAVRLREHTVLFSNIMFKRNKKIILAALLLLACCLLCIWVLRLGMNKHYFCNNCKQYFDRFSYIAEYHRELDSGETIEYISVCPHCKEQDYEECEECILCNDPSTYFVCDVCKETIKSELSELVKRVTDNGDGKAKERVIEVISTLIELDEI